MSADEKAYLRVYQFRVLARLTQIELARILNVHPVTISKWECDHAKPSAWHLELIGVMCHSPDAEKIKAAIYASSPVTALPLAIRHRIK